MSNSDKTETQENKNVLHKIWLICKWLIPVAALVYLWREGVFSGEALQLGSAVSWSLPVALLFLSATTLAIAVRFHCLLRCQGVQSTLTGQLRLNFPGLLVQQFASETAFDAMRLFYAKKIGGTNAILFATIMADRLLGLIALVAITALCLTRLWGDAGGMYVIALAVVGILMLPCAFIIARILHQRQYRWFQRIPGSAFIATVGETLVAFQRHIPALTGLFCLSCMSHLSFFLALYFCGLALNHAAPTPVESIAAGAVSVFTGILPLPMAGIGVGEAAFGETVARMRGDDMAANFAAVFLVNRILLILLGIVSWLIAAIFGEKASAVPAEK